MSRSPTTPVVREVGDSALLLEFDARIDPAVNDLAVAAAATVRAYGLAGVRDVVAAFRSVAVFFDPTRADASQVASALREAVAGPAPAVRGQVVQIPVVYGGEAGPDLDEVAEWAGLSSAGVIARHAAQEYRVYTMGFLPGFAYLGTVDSAVAAPRRARPRVHVPRGSVGIAGSQTGVYPMTSPGGWQLVGRSHVRMFDIAREPISLLAVGDRVRFRPEPGPWRDAGAETSRAAARLIAARQVTVVTPGLFTTVQDLGRWGYQDRGVPVAGAMDVDACRRANRAVGNAPGAAVLEVTLIGPELHFESGARVAVAGADLSPALDGRALPRDRATTASPSSVLRFGERRGGARAYVAFDGGVNVPLVLGSRATHARSALGGLDGRPLQSGDRLGLGRVSGEPVAMPERWLPDGGARVRVLPGPQLEAFGAGALDALTGTRFVISPQSDRMGYRLDGPVLPGAPAAGTMISDVTFPGAIQVPPSGEPILLLADRPTTGGYPQIGVVATADLDTVGQLAPGDWIEFAPCTRVEAVAALEGEGG